jgi:hypothetical protein
MKSNIYNDIYCSNELAYHLTEVICTDDKCELTDLPHDLVISEANYVLSKYIGNLGFGQQEDFEGENGQEAYQEAKQNVNAIKSFLKKWG